MCDLLMKKFYGKPKRNNKGFTLVELIVAITLLVIVVTPIMNSFITSARVNRNARKVMVATDVAQNFIEGYSEKTFESVMMAFTRLNSGNLSGNAAFTTFNDGVYNLSSNWVNLNADTTLTGAFTDITNKSLKYNGTVYNTKDIISDNTITNSMNQVFEKQIINHGISSSENKVYYFMASATEGGVVLENEGLLYMAYTNIKAVNGYKFNVVVLLMPTASSIETEQLFYTYNIKVTMYDAEDLTTDSFGQPVVTLLGGIASK